MVMLEFIGTLCVAVALGVGTYRLMVLATPEKKPPRNGDMPSIEDVISKVSKTKRGRKP